MANEPTELPPVIVVAKADSLSIRAGHIYQFREYTDANYRRWGDEPPRQPLGTLEGVGGAAPCCVHYPKHLTVPLNLNPFPELDWM